MLLSNTVLLGNEIFGSVENNKISLDSNIGCYMCVSRDISSLNNYLLNIYSMPDMVIIVV